MENAEKGQLPPAPLGWHPHTSFAAKYFKLMNKKNDKDSLNVYSLISAVPNTFENNMSIAVQGTVIDTFNDDDDEPTNTLTSPVKSVENNDPHSLYYKTAVYFSSSSSSLSSSLSSSSSSSSSLSSSSSSSLSSLLSSLLLSFTLS